MPAVKAGLLTIIATALPTLQVAWAHPGKNIAKESVFLGDAQFTDETVAALRTTPRPHTEEYAVPVHVDIVADGDDAQVTETRAWAVVAPIEDAIRNAPTLGNVTGLLNARVAGKFPQNYMSDQGRVTRIDVTVLCQARI